MHNTHHCCQGLTQLRIACNYSCSVKQFPLNNIISMIKLFSVKTPPISSATILLLEKLHDCKFCWISPQLTFCVFGIMPFNVLEPLVGTSQFLFRFFLWRFRLFHLCLHFCLCLILFFLCHLPSLSICVSSFLFLSSFGFYAVFASLLFFALCLCLFASSFLFLSFLIFFHKKLFESSLHKMGNHRLEDIAYSLKDISPQKDNAFSKKPQSMQDESFHKWKP